MVDLLEAIFKLDRIPPYDHGIKSTDLKTIRIAIILQNEMISLSKLSNVLTYFSILRAQAYEVLSLPA